ncbi:hypothetical protein B0O99DRAFT_696587 [Bisporella sp. PMI_857]|nr:hypothetical protein B0O99DRAFT_696587 [Bisporella sp. PMI_857]
MLYRRVNGTFVNANDSDEVVKARDEHVFPTEDDRHDVATILLFQSYTGSRPAEFVHSSKSKASEDPLKEYNDNSNAGNSPEYNDDLLFDSNDDETADENNLFHESTNKKAGHNSGYSSDETDVIITKNTDDCYPVEVNGAKRLVQQNCNVDELDEFKEAIRNTTFLFRENPLPILCPISHILTRAIRNDAIFVDGYTSAEPFFATNLETNAIDNAVRDQVIKHDPFTGVFNEAYINHVVRFNVQNAFLESNVSDDKLTRAFTHISIRCNPEAPKKVPNEMINRLFAANPDIKYKFIKRAPKKKRKKHEDLRKQLTNTKKSLKTEIEDAYRKDYFFQIHNEIIKKQLQKHLDKSVVKENAKDIEPVIEHQLEKRTRLQQVLCDLSKNLGSQAIVARKVSAINLIVALASRQEFQTRKPRSAPAPKNLVKEKSPAPELFLPPDEFPVICKKTQCIFCTGNEQLPYKQRTRTFKRVSHIWNHVENVHLCKVPAEQRIIYSHPIQNEAAKKAAQRHIPTRTLVSAAPSQTHEDYQIGVICALATEKAAIVAMLDETHPKLKKKNGNDNEYTLSRIEVHNVVIACLPAGLIRNSPAAIVANNMRRSFPIKFSLIVGIRREV